MRPTALPQENGSHLTHSESERSKTNDPSDRSRLPIVVLVVALLTTASLALAPLARAGSPQPTENSASQTVAWAFLDIFSFLGISSTPDKVSPEEPRKGKAAPFVETKPDTDPGTKDQTQIEVQNAAPCGGPGITRYVGGSGAPNYPSIQAAINASSFINQDTIQIAAGNYTEQLIVNKCVTLKGASSTSTFLNSPTTLNSSAVPGVSNTYSVIEVRSNASVKISDLTVQGQLPVNSCAPSYYGIFVVENAALTLRDAKIDAIRSSAPYLGCQNVVALRAGSVGFSQTGSIDLQRVTVSNYGKGGIVVSNTGSNGTIKDTYVMGDGAQVDRAQNGIQINDGATATVTNSTIAGNVCDNPACSFNNYYSYGLLLIAPGSGTTVTGNTFDVNDAGIYAWTPGQTTTIDGNTFKQVRYSGTDLDEGTHTFTNNFVTGGSFGPVTGVGVLAYAGATGPSAATIKNNSITDASQANVWLQDFDTLDAFFPTADVSFTRLSGSGYGIQNQTTATTVSQANNFWGCNVGPNGGTGCATTDGLVATSQPYLKLAVTPSPADVNSLLGGVPPTSSTVTADLRFNSNNVNVFTSTDHLPEPQAGTVHSALTPGGIPVGFASTCGTNGPSPQALTAGVATTTFTAIDADGGNCTGGTTGSVDNASVLAAITVHDTHAPSVAIVANGPNPTNGSTISFTATFSEPVTTLSAAGVAIGGTSGGSATSVFQVAPNDGTKWQIDVTGMTSSGAVSATVNAAAVNDTAVPANPNTASNTASVGYFTGALELVVDDLSVNCLGNGAPVYSTIESAVAAASSNYIIRVCAGTYPLGTNTFSITQAGLTIVKAEAAKPLVQVSKPAGTQTITVFANNVTIDGLNFVKTDGVGEHNLIGVQGTGFTGQNNDFTATTPWTTGNYVCRAFVISGSATGLNLLGNTFTDFRQPAYISGDGVTILGNISNNTATRTKGWVVDEALLNFTGNSFGVTCPTCDADIALISFLNNSSQPASPTFVAHYAPYLALSSANDNAFIRVKIPFDPQPSGRAVTYVDDGAPAVNPDGRTPGQYRSTIQDGADNTLPGGTVQVASGTYNEDVNVTRPLKIVGAGSATTTISGPIGGPNTTVKMSAANIDLSGFTITRAGNNTTDWNNPGLNSAGLAIQSAGVAPGAVIHDNVFFGNRTGIDINNTGTDSITVRNNLIENNRTGMILRNQTDNLTVVENSISDNWTAGILFLDGSSGTNSPVNQALASAFVNNKISGNWYGEVVDRQFGGSLPAPGAYPKNFQGNWYGTAAPVVTTANSAEPGYGAQIPVIFGGGATAPGGQPDIAGPASANIRYDMPLEFGTDTNVETIPGRGTYGFQGVNIVVDSATTINDPDPNPPGWFFWNEGPNGSGGLETGPPPSGVGHLGSGSARLSIDTTGRQSFGTGAYGGVRLRDITKLKFKTWTTGPDAPVLQFDVDNDLNDHTTIPDIQYQGRINFIPAGAVIPNVWQQWDLLAPGTMVWGSGSPSNPNRPFTAACPQSNPCTLASLLANNTFKDLGVRLPSGNGRLLFRAGGPSSTSITEYVDDFEIGLKTGNTTYDFESDGSDAPDVASMTRNDPTPTAAASVSYKVIFTEPVVGVDAADFALTTSGVTGAGVTGVTGSGTTYTVSVSTGSGSGSIQLKTDAAASITDVAGNPYVPTDTGETYAVDRDGPTVTIEQAPLPQTDPTSTTPVKFVVVFTDSSAVSGFATGDVTIATGSGTAFGSTVPSATVTQTGPYTYEVAVTNMDQPGQVTATIAAGVAQDAAGNPSLASTSMDNSVYYTAGLSPLVVDDDGAASATNCDDATPTAYTTIQAAVDAAVSGNTIKVCPGVYEELLTVNKSLTINGPNAGIDPNATAPVDATSAIIRLPDSATGDPTFSGPYVVAISAQDVKIDGFTIDGDNPAVVTGNSINGADIDAGVAIEMPDNGFNGLTDPRSNISNNYIRNFGELGIDMLGNNAAGNANSTIANNKFHNIPGAGFYGAGVYVGNNGYANVTGNVMTNVSLGIVIENMSAANSGANPVVSGNTITTRSIGIRPNLMYNFTTTNYQITGNTINSYIDSSSGITPRTTFRGIRIESIQQTVPLTVSGNTITADRGTLQTAGFTRIDGIWLTNTSTASPNIVISGNTISNMLRGISQTTPATPTVTCNSIYNNDVGIYVGHDIQYGGTTESYATGGLNASQNNLVGNTSFGVQVDTTAGLPPDAGGTTIGPVAAANNYWGSADGPGPIATGLGDLVSAGVTYAPFSTAANSCAPAISYPTVTIEQAATPQTDPTNTSPVNFTVVFSESVTGFSSSDIRLSGTATGMSVGTITGSGTTYNVPVNVTGDGTVIADVYSGGGLNGSGVPSVASTSSDNSITYDTTAPTAIVSTTAGVYTNASGSPIPFQVVFSEPVVGFSASSLTVVNGSVGTITSSGCCTYSFSVTPSGEGTVSVTVAAGGVTDPALNPNPVSNTAGTVYDSIAPTVTIDQRTSPAQADPTSTSPVHFTVVFTDTNAVTGFTSSDVSIATGSGTAFGPNSNPLATVSSIDAYTYNVAVSGMNQSGSVTVTIPAGAAVDSAGNTSSASTSSDNSVQFTLVNTDTLVTPTNMQGWAFFQENAGTASGRMVTGPLTPPSGTGSARLTVDAAAGEAFGKLGYSGVRFDQITALSFSGYQFSGLNPSVHASLAFDVDSDITDTSNAYQGRIVYEPSNDPTVTFTSGWQNFDAMSPTARFWGSTGSGSRPLTAACPQTNPCTRAQILALFPHLGVRNAPNGVIVFKAGSGAAPGLDVSVDKLVVGVNSVNETYNFDETPPTVAIADATIKETQSGQTLNFAVTRTGTSTLPATVTVNTSDATATAGSDYTAISNQIVTIPASTNAIETVNVSVPIVGDTTVETDETFSVSLSNATNAAITDNSATGTITNNDVELSFAAATQNVGESAGSAVITVNRNGATTGSVSANFSATGGTANPGPGTPTNPDDYDLTPGSVSIGGSAASGTFSVTINSDNISEVNETVSLALSGATAADPTDNVTIVSPSSSTLTITDDDGSGYVTIAGSVKAYNNGGAQTGIQNVTMTLQGSGITTPITTTTDTNGDYSFPASSMYAISGGDFSVTPSCPSNPTCNMFVFDPSSREYINQFTAVSNANFLGYNGDNPRNMRIASPTQPTAGSNVILPVYLDSRGDENSFNFVLNYDSSRLNFISAACGSAVAGPNCTVTTAPGSGTVYVQLDLAPGVTFPAGADEAVKLTFSVAPFSQCSPSALNTPVTFSTAPATRNVSNVDGISLPADYINGQVVFSAYYEADVAGGSPGNSGIGDCVINSGDVTRIRGLVGGLISVNSNTNEFQRADAAPYTSRGDGILNSGDITVARRYAAGDLLGVFNPASGPTGTARMADVDDDTKERQSVAAASTTMRVVSKTAYQNSFVTVPFEMDAQGIENAFNFSFSYDTAKLGSPVVTLGSGAASLPGVVLTVNTSQQASGRIGVLVDWSPGSPITAGTKLIVNVQFATAPSVLLGPSSVAFTTSPLGLSVTDSLGDPVTAIWNSGNVTFVAPPTSAGVAVSGIAKTSEGNPIANVRVTLTSGDAIVGTSVTNGMGFFRFDSVPSGASYVINGSSKRFSFQPRIINVGDEVTGADLIAEP